MQGDSLFEHQRLSWNENVRKKNIWTIPVSHEVISEARKGNFGVYLTPMKHVPRDWFPESFEGKEILCLASGGGQQAPVFAALGANVTSYDLSDEQLKRDREVAEREKLQIKTVQGNAQDLSAFADESFDFIFNPVSMVFIPDVLPVWRECYRVLKKGGILVSGNSNPWMYLFDDDNFNNNKLVFRPENTLPHCTLKEIPEEKREEFLKRNIPVEYSSTLSDLVGGQIKAGFAIIGFYEDGDDNGPFYKICEEYIATKAIKL